MEIHAWLKPIRSAKDFLLHILTIAIGLFLALGLENATERSHHKKLVRTAKENLAMEIHNNQNKIAEYLPRLQKTAGQLNLFSADLRKIKTDRNSVLTDEDLTFKELLLSASAWNTASLTGALGYMEYGQVNSYATIYEMQQRFNDVKEKTSTSWVAMSSSFQELNGIDDFSMIETSTLDNTIEHVNISIANVDALISFANALNKAYDSAKLE